MTTPADRSRARERALGLGGPSRTRTRQHELGEVGPEERARLAAGFGTQLRVERGYRSQRELAELTGIGLSSIVRLENGTRRPTAASIWRIARALRTGLRNRVVLDERLRRLAGPSFRDYGRRPHAAREQMRVQLAVEASAAGAPLVGEGDTLGAVICAALDDAAHRDAGAGG